MLGSKRASPSARPPPAGSGGGAPPSPIGTPSIQDIGDGQTSYSAIHGRGGVTSARDFHDDDRDEDRERDSEAHTSSIGPDVEMRGADSLDSEGNMTRERRLTIKQLERFRRAIANHQRRKAGIASPRWAAKTRRDSTNPGDFDNVFGDAQGGARELRIVVYPWGMWMLGIAIVIAASIFLSQVHSKAMEHKRFGEKEDYNWWKYLVAIIVFVAGFGVILNGRVENFVMSKDTGRLEICSTKPLCLGARLRRTRKVERELGTIVDIRVEASGEILSGEVDTRAYRVHFDFANGSHTTALEGRSKKKALVRCRLIKQFLLSCVPGGGDMSPTAAAAGGPGVVLPARVGSAGLGLGSGMLASQGFGGGSVLVLPAPATTATATLTVDPVASSSSSQLPPVSPRKMVAAVPISSLSQRTIAAQTPHANASVQPTTVPGDSPA